MPKVSANLDDETDRLLERIAQQEWRSKSSTLVLLIKREAAARGMLATAPKLLKDSAGG